MATELSNFIRFGGRSQIVLRLAATGSLSTKEAVPRGGTLRIRFAANLDRVGVANADTLERVLRSAFNSPLTPADMTDLSADKADVFAEWGRRVAVIATEWGRQPDRFEAVRLQMEDDLLRAFAALANERRQAFLGVTHYVWRSRDDERVRHAPAWSSAAAAGRRRGSSRRSLTSP